MDTGFTKLVSALAVFLGLAGCATAPARAPQTQTQPVQAVPDAGPRVSSSQAVANFRRVVTRVEPVAEQVCRAQTQGIDCDFQIKVDTRDGQPVNAFHTVNREGEPLIVFTVALLADARNQDELAFIMGHEAAHHIAGHLVEMKQNAAIGALAGGVLATVLSSGASGAARDSLIQQATEAGAFVGARSYSKENELEADALGTVITARAGYDPIRGSAFFNRLPDPGDRFLGSHPPNAQRSEVVRKVAAGL